MNNTKNRRRIYHPELLETGILPWTSWKTTKRKIENAGFPATWADGKWCFDVKEVEIWFKKREKKSA